MGSPAAAYTNDPASPIAALSAAEKVQVGLCGGGDGDGQDTCNRGAAVLKNLIDRYAKSGSFLKRFIMWWNTENDDRTMARFEEAAAGKPIEEVDPEGRTFKSMVSITDDRTNLNRLESNGENYELEVAVMASKFAYENAARAKDLVSKKLEGEKFEFFDCPNLSLGEAETTQAMAFVRKKRMRNVVYVAFRGSSEVNDWRANLDCGLIEVSRAFGKVHVGFMKALGLVGNTGSFDRDFPKELPKEQWKNPPAYYAVRQWLMCVVEQLGKEEDPIEGGGPKIVVRVVGHSLGGALAILFVAMLRYHKTTIPLISSMVVITMGQPRVGDSTFANYMIDSFINIGPGPLKITYKRMVYSYDPVPRVPNDDGDSYYSTYRHFGTCLYYKDWFHKLKSTDDRNMDYPSVNLRNVLAYGRAADKKNKEDKQQAWANREILQEPASVVSDRKMNLFLLQFHTVGEYLNAARHGKEGGPRPPSLVRRLLRSLLHYPTSSFCNRSRSRRGVIATTDDDDVSSYV